MDDLVTISKPGAVLEVRAAPIPAWAQEAISRALREGRAERERQKQSMIWKLCSFLMNVGGWRCCS